MMKRTTGDGLGDAFALAACLRALGAIEPPSTLRRGTLVRVGLADQFWRVTTPIGQLIVAANAAGISTVARDEADETFTAAFAVRFGRPVWPAGESPVFGHAVERWLATGERAGLRFDLRGRTPFERAVLDRTLAIPRGEVRPYAWVAREIGRPGAVRAVGSALGRNPVPLLVPCHRVVRSDGVVGDYVFGAAAKRVVLRSEGISPDELARQARRGVRLTGSETTKIFCFPTCRHARRTSERYRVVFASAAAAAAAGYRPCRVCRPAVAS